MNAGPQREFEFTLNGRAVWVRVEIGATLLELLRAQGCPSVKFSDERGEGGADTVLLDEVPVSAATLLALQVAGRRVETLEGLREDPWVAALAERFLNEGAVQCGYCTPAFLVQLEALRRRNPAPDEAAIREALTPVFCRCTGMVKPLRAARVAFGLAAPREEEGGGRAAVQSSETPLRVVGRDARRVDGRALVRGEPVFAGDLTPPGALTLKILASPHAHARLRAIDTSAALRVPGVVDIATWPELPRIAYTSAGQGFPEPSPYDCYLLDEKVRHVGDKVALVVAETAAAAEAACAAIAVDYQLLPHILDERDAQKDGAPLIHDEPRPADPQAALLCWPADPAHNVAARTHLDLGDVEAGFAAAAQVVEHEYRTHQVQQCSLEPHVCSSWWDPDGRLTIRTSTQVPFHVRRVVDMSEYMEKFAVSRLIGAPPGYVGYEEGGQLTEKVRRRPYSIVLLDEIEKAHPDVFNLLLQALDDGQLTDSLGRKIDFRNSIIIMTSNIGARQLADFGSGVGFGTKAKTESTVVDTKGVIESALRKAFAPEFLNRIDDVVMFNSLKREHIHEIIDLELSKLFHRITDLGYTVQLTTEAKDHIADKGFDEKFGARPLKRAIQKYLEDPLAEEIIKSKLSEGDVIEVGLDKTTGELLFSSHKPAGASKKKSSKKEE